MTGPRLNITPDDIDRLAEEVRLEIGYGKEYLCWGTGTVDSKEWYLQDLIHRVVAKIKALKGLKGV